MSRWFKSFLAGVLVSGFALSALAAKEQLEVGEEVNRFTLKAVNTDVTKVRFIGIDQYYGADAKEPKKAILLTFFATYCEPCKREMPFLAALYDTYKDRGLMILSVSIDKEPDQIEFIKTLAAKAGVTFPVLTDNFNIVAKRYYVAKLPCVYLVDAAGKVTWTNVGYSDDASKTMLENIRKAVGESPTEPEPEALAKLMSSHAAPAALDTPPTAAVDKVDEPPPTKGKAKGKGGAKAKKKKK
jgi:alkyl hydroperoxide reductase subunit AhpC